MNIAAIQPLFALQVACLSWCWRRRQLECVEWVWGVGERGTKSDADGEASEALAGVRLSRLGLTATRIEGPDHRGPPHRSESACGLCLP